MRRLALGALALLALLLAGSSVMVIDSDEVAVVMRLGAWQRTEGSGLALRLPWPLETDERVRVTEARQAEPGRVVLLTGDTNLVEVDVVAQYTIADPLLYLLLDDPEAAVTATVSAQLAAAVSAMEVEVLLTTGRSTLEQQVQRSAERALGTLGIRLDAVELRALEPPAPVVAAFNDVSSARGDRDTMVLSAQSYASQQLPRVRGEATQLHEQARTRAAERVSQARADVARFEALLPSWRTSPAAVRRALVEEAAAQVSPRVTVAAQGEVVLP